jgi:hypothetical protein
MLQAPTLRTYYAARNVYYLARSVFIYRTIGQYTSLVPYNKATVSFDYFPTMLVLSVRQSRLRVKSFGKL